MEPLTHAQYLTSHTAFLLAAVFRPAEAPALAAQCLLPVADVLPARGVRQVPLQPWLSVKALVAHVGKEEVPQHLIYEAWVADLVLALRRRMARWPRLWQDPVRAYVAVEYDVRMEDPQDLAVLAREASAARQEALEALYGEEGAAFYGPAAWEVWAEAAAPEAPPREEEDEAAPATILRHDGPEGEEDAAEASWQYFLEDYEEYHLGSGEPPIPEAELRQAWQRCWEEEQAERRGRQKVR